MNFRPIPHRFFFTSLIVLALGLSHSARECEAAPSQPDKKKTVTPSQKTSFKSPKRKSQQKPSDYEPTRDGPQAGGGPAGAFGPSGMTDISDNPGFFAVRNKTPEPGVPQDIDKLIRPVLKRLFKDAKLVEDIGEQPPKVDGEVEENKLVYVVRQLLIESDGDQLHAVLDKEAGFSLSPRLGAKPTHIRGHQKVWMSLLKSTSLRGYSFVIEVNYGTQRITVISYRLGSKYDRFG
jgi:hypothetical protein